MDRYIMIDITDAEIADLKVHLQNPELRIFTAVRTAASALEKGNVATRIARLAIECDKVRTVDPALARSVYEYAQRLHPKVTLVFPKSRVDAFRHDVKSGLRWGQAFYDYMKLERIQQPDNQDFCDMLQAMRSDEDAKLMVAKYTDPNN
jgi:hypothetical protein